MKTIVDHLGDYSWIIIFSLVGLTVVVYFLVRFFLKPMRQREVSEMWKLFHIPGGNEMALVLADDGVEFGRSYDLKFSEFGCNGEKGFLEAACDCFRAYISTVTLEHQQKLREAGADKVKCFQLRESYDKYIAKLEEQLMEFMVAYKLEVQV